MTKKIYKDIEKGLQEAIEVIQDKHEPARAHHIPDSIQEEKVRQSFEQWHLENKGYAPVWVDNHYKNQITQGIYEAFRDALLYNIMFNWPPREQEALDQMSTEQSMTKSGILKQAFRLYHSVHTLIKRQDVHDIADIAWPHKLMGKFGNPIVICDLDGTLTDCSHREHYMQKTSVPIGIIR